MKPLAIAFSGAGRGLMWEMVRVIQQMYNVNLFRIVAWNPALNNTS
jgi:hypothetical protein